MKIRHAAALILLLGMVPSGPAAARTCLDYRSVGPGEEPPLRAVLPLPGLAADVAVLAGHAYLACGADGLRIVELSDPDHPAAVGHLGLNGADAARIAVLGCQAFVATGAALEVVDITAAYAPVALRRLVVGETVADVAAAGERLVAVAGAGLLMAWPVGPCSLPGAAASVALGSAPRRVAVAGLRAFVATAGGLAVVDLADAAGPVLAARLDPAFDFAAVAVWGDSLVAVAGATLRFYAPADASARLLRSVVLPAPGLDVGADGAEIHTLTGTAWTVHGTAFHDLRIPVGTGALPTAAAGMALAATGVHFAAGSAGLVTGWRQCAIDPPAAVLGRSQAVRLRATPNPANPRVTLHVEGSAAGTGALTIYDLRGRRLTVLRDAVVAEGSATYIWAGRDASGRVQPSGRYVARWRAAGEDAAVSFLLVR